MAMYPDLRGKVAIVTGSGRPKGLGEAMARRLAAEGCKVVLTDIGAARGKEIPADAIGSSSELESIVADIRSQGGDALGVICDVLEESQVQALVEKTVAHFGRLDIMVNNAGISHPNQPMLDVSEEFFDRLFQVNVKSIYLSAVHCVPVFRRQKRGCFINIGSTAAVRPRPGLTWYNGSKGAVILLTKSMAVELAPDNIRVNAINPAIADTPLLTTFMGVADTPENRARFLASIPLGRLCESADVANAALFLADPASNFVTGVCMEVDGGRCI